MYIDTLYITVINDKLNVKSTLTVLYQKEQILLDKSM